MAESKKMGRPKAEDSKCRNIQVRFTESEYAKIKACAKNDNQSIMRFVRELVLEKMFLRKGFTRAT